jgi:hypothetical protein
MVFQSVPNGIEVVLKAVQNGVPIVNVFNIKDSATHDEALLSEYCDGFAAWWRTNMKPMLSNSYVLQTITATSLILASGPQHSLSLTTTNQGDLTGEQVAGNAACVISWRTASIGRSFRGRSYIGGLDAAATETAQVVSASFASALSSAAVALTAAVADIGGALCVLSRFALGVARVTGLLTEIVSIIVDTKIDSQRRRTAN